MNRTFAFVVVAFALVLIACVVPVFIPLSGSSSIDIPDLPGAGILDVNIDYTGIWYRDTFNYTREAENIRHFVLVMPESEAARATPNFAFASIAPEANLSIGTHEDMQEYAWVRDYLHEAPGGHFHGEFAPGGYEIAAAFIAILPSDAQDGEFWYGVYGGGASTDYQPIDIAAGETTSVTIQLSDSNGWACPWLYVFNGDSFERRTEILRNLRGEEFETTEITPIGAVTAVDGWITVRVAEEKDEVTYLDSFYLLINDVAIPAESDVSTAAQVAVVDSNYLTIRQDEFYEFRFRAPESFSDDDTVAVSATGYYVPVE